MAKHPVASLTGSLDWVWDKFETTGIPDELRKLADRSVAGKGLLMLFRALALCAVARCAARLKYLASSRFVLALDRLRGGHQ